MFKTLIKPIQEILLKKHYCVGCTYNLDKILNRTKIYPNKEILQCKCSRRYIWDSLNNVYKRASFEEEDLYLKKTSKQK